MKRIVIATNNQHKVEEIQMMLKGTDCLALSLQDIGFYEDIEETGTTFIENACIKAKAISLICDDFVMADDSGLEIDAWNKEPGVHSARYLGHDTPYAQKNMLILEKMQMETNRTARFVSAIALYQRGEMLHMEQAFMEGEIAKEIMGAHGFGYDPIFYYPPKQKSNAQMTTEEKNAVSHRGQALRAMMHWVQSNVR